MAQRSSPSVLSMAASIIVGGAAAIYVVKNLGILDKLKEGREDPSGAVVEQERQPPGPRRLQVGDYVVVPPIPPRPAAATPSGTSAKAPPTETVVVAIPSQTITTDPPQAPNVSPPAVASTERSTWTTEMDGIFSQMPSLRERYTAIHLKLDPLAASARESEAENNAAQVSGRKIKAAYSTLERRAGVLQQARLLTNDTSDIDSELSSLRFKMADLESDFRAVDSQARRAQASFQDLTVAAKPLLMQLAPVEEEARRLELKMLELLGPFEPVPLDEQATAEAYFDQGVSIARGGDASWSFFGRGCLRFRGDKVAGGFDDLNKAVELAPKQSTFLAVRGFASFSAGEEKRGRDDLVAATKADETNATARYYYALVLFRSGAFATAEQQLRDAMEKSPKEPAAFQLLALFKATSAVDSQRSAILATKNAEAAQLLTSSPSWQTLAVLAAAKAEAGRFAEAATLADQAAELAPKHRADWCRKCAETFRDSKPLRIDWKTSTQSPL